MIQTYSQKLSTRTCDTELQLYTGVIKHQPEEIATLSNAER